MGFFLTPYMLYGSITDIFFSFFAISDYARVGIIFFVVESVFGKEKNPGRGSDEGIRKVTFGRVVCADDG